MAADFAECQSLGADDCLIKPVGFKNLGEATPHLSMGWTLVKSAAGDSSESEL